MDDLTPGVNYQVAARAINAAGAASAVGEDAEKIAPGDTTRPSTVTGVSAARISLKVVRIRWGKLNDDTVSEYIIYAGSSSAPTNEVGRTDGTEFIDDAAYSATRYWRVKAVDYSGNTSSDYSTVVSAQGAKVGDVDIQSLSANKLTAGLLEAGGTDHPTGIRLNAGADLVLREGSTGILASAQIIFQDDSGTGQSKIFSGIGSNILFLNPDNNNTIDMSIGSTPDFRWRRLRINAATEIEFNTALLDVNATTVTGIGTTSVSGDITVDDITADFISASEMRLRAATGSTDLYLRKRTSSGEANIVLEDSNGTDIAVIALAGNNDVAIYPVTTKHTLSLIHISSPRD